jgi:hypothetical protein
MRTMYLLHTVRIGKRILSQGFGWSEADDVILKAANG